MKTSGFKKHLSLVLSILMVFTMIPATVFTLAAEENYPVIEAYNAASSGGFHKYWNKVYSVTFLDEIDEKAIAGALESWDVSAAKDGSVMSWMYLNDEATATAGDKRYDVYIAGDGGVGANPNSSWIFYMFSSLEKIINPENFKTNNATTFFKMFAACNALKEVDLSSWDVSNVTTLESMFFQCYALEYANLSGWDTSNVTNMKGVFEMTPPTGVSPDYSLKSIDLTGWDTSNVTTMENMFKNCEALTELDLSSFNTSKVTTMRFMFYYCKQLKNIYVGEGWTTEAIANINDGVFNCCYALIGGKDDQAENEKIYADKHPSAYYPPSVEYAKFREDGGYLDNVSNKPEPEKKEYTVTYEFIGDVIPAGVSVVSPAVYEEGLTVDVADAPYAEGYEFSGWSSEDADITSGSFVIENDVHIVGSWTKIKLYKVEYKYTEGYEVPADAPVLPDAVYYKAGDSVDRAGVIYADGYIFVGWNTEDADAAGDMFIMPENDVVFYGYFKKPVESVEIINDGDIVINEDGKAKINVYVKPEDATIKDIIYESSDESVVTVDKYGNIEAVGEGTATITVYSKDDPTKSDTVTVTVKIPVTEITVDKTVINLNKGDTDKITPTVNEDATNKKVIYESSDETVVKVDENGNIEAVGEGEATITVKSEDDPNVKKEIKVTVKIPVTEITAAEDFTLEVDEIKNLEAKVNEDATNKGLVYESSDPGIVKVDNDGNVTAVGEGTATITIISKDDNTVTETVTVTVIRKYKVTYEFIGNVIPENVTAPEMAEYVSGSEVTVEDNSKADGYVFSGWSTKDNADIEDGKFIINNDVHFVGSWSKLYSVTYEYEGEVPEGAPALPEKEAHTADEDVYIKNVPVVEGYTFTGWTTTDADVQNGKFSMPEKDVVLKGKFEKIIIDVEDVIIPEEKIELEIGGKDKIEVTVTPDNATNKEVEYKSSNESIVKVDENGNIEAVGEGTATITVTSKADPTKKDTITITVKKPVVDVEDVIVPEESIELEIGGKDKIEVTVTPDDATNKEVEYKSSNEKVVKVDEDGNIEAVGEGTATITVTSKSDPTKKDTITITVKKPVVDVEDVDIPKDRIDLLVGDKNKVPVTVTPDNATNKEVEYKSSDESIVKVDENGIIEAVDEGTATITVTSKADSTKKDTIIVTVKKPVPQEPVYTITVPESFSMVMGEKKPLGVVITPDDGKIIPVYTSADENIVRVDANGNVTAIGVGTTTISVDLGGGDIRIVPVVIVAPAIPSIPRKHHIAFGKTDGIGWYEVSVNGGDFFPQGPNSTLEVYEGSILVVRVQDMWIDDNFTFYVNGDKVKPDAANTITVVVDGYMLIGALSMDVEVPDVDESLSLFEKILNAIKDFFRWLFKLG